MVGNQSWRDVVVKYCVCPGSKINMKFWGPRTAFTLNDVLPLVLWLSLVEEVDLASLDPVSSSSDLQIKTVPTYICQQFQIYFQIQQKYHLFQEDYARTHRNWTMD